MTYMQFILEYLNEQDFGVPIYTETIAGKMADYFGTQKKKAAAATAVAMKRIIDDNKLPDLRFYQKGVYYRTVMTPFGEMGISKQALIADKYLIHDSGYETGKGLLHRLGLTTQMPGEHLFATNAAKDCVRFDKKLEVSVCPPKTHITAENKYYLQILDAIELLDKAPVDAENPYRIIANHIRLHGLQYETLLYYADKYYTRKTILTLAHTASRTEERI